MIEHTLDTVRSVLYLRPKTALEPGDFVEVARTVDPYIAKTGGLNGLVIDAPAFPGWQSLGAMAAHFRFVRDHQKHIKRIALARIGLRQCRRTPGVTLCVGRDQTFSGRRS